MDNRAGKDYEEKMDNREEVDHMEGLDDKVQMEQTLYFPSLMNPGLLGHPGLQDLKEPITSLVQQRAPGPNGRKEARLGPQSLRRWWTGLMDGSTQRYTGLLL